MTSFSPGMGSCSYWYRADGMRIQKVVDTGTVRPDDDSGFWDENLAVNKPTTRYYHDGQSVFEEDFTRYEGGTAIKTHVLRYALGARGIEMIAWLPDGGSWGYKYPLYDFHGNMVATMHRGTGGAYTLGDVKLYDAWGNVRSGSGGPTQRYCAGLGHVQDDESSLIYMRARYYEPTTGRFVSEDSARDGWNWFSYASNEPVGRSDPSGASDSFSDAAMLAVLYHAMVPIGDNPFLARAMNDFNGFIVPEKWQKELISRLNPFKAYSIGNVFSAGSYLLNFFRLDSIGDGAWKLSSRVLGMATGVLAIAEAQQLMLVIALVSCDMAFEDGM